MGVSRLLIQIPQEWHLLEGTNRFSRYSGWSTMTVFSLKEMHMNAKFASGDHPCISRRKLCNREIVVYARYCCKPFLYAPLYSVYRFPHEYAVVTCSVSCFLLFQRV
ncbi:uncharacterized protein CLUP02_03558 [Colletotrichum lupini]|uniref:Uncharacterized protein n=1 Tax=Colletotrichum lupini TaxID=145971 RepID=A0A9Q8WCA6_9PEZI|nr:uncharacterized protein CLUP02_03558 [Colletotrichum lupini]UQC78084.1 hypothetical protein CLUP02_03558 [Colletotrichum lupini]